MKRHSCYDRPPLKDTVTVQDGYISGPFFNTRIPVMVEMPDPMTKDCQYSRNTTDPVCAGCRWNAWEKV